MSDSDHVSVSFIATSYNDGAYLLPNVERVIDILKHLKYPFEIVFVDDKSQDDSLVHIKEFIKSHPDVRFQLVEHEINKGRGRTVSDGIIASRGLYVGYIDIDLSTSPWYILPLIEQLERGADVVTGYRFYNHSVKVLHRALFSWGYRIVLQIILGGYYGDTETGCKFFRRDKVISVLPHIKDERWFWDTEVMVRSRIAGLKLSEVPTVFVRKDSYTTVKLFRDSWRAFRNLLSLRAEVMRQKKSNSTHA